METKKGKVTDVDLRSYFKDNALHYLFILEIDEEDEYLKYLTQAEYNMFISKVLAGFGVREIREVADKTVEYVLDDNGISKIILQNNIEI